MASDELFVDSTVTLLFPLFYDDSRSDINNKATLTVTPQIHIQLTIF